MVGFPAAGEAGRPQQRVDDLALQPVVVSAHAHAVPISLVTGSPEVRPIPFEIDSGIEELAITRADAALRGLPGVPA